MNYTAMPETGFIDLNVDIWKFLRIEVLKAEFLRDKFRGVEARAGSAWCYLVKSFKSTLQ